MGKEIKLGVVSTFRCPCGVAHYFEELAYELDRLVDLKIYAEELHVEKEDNPIKTQPLKYVRNWKRGEGYSKLYNDIIDDKIDLLHLEWEDSMYNENMFSKSKIIPFLDKLHEAEIPVVMTLHNVPQFNAGLPYTGWYKNTGCSYIVTNELMHKELLKWEPTVKVTTIPLGSTLFTPTETMKARELLSLPKDKYLITQTGFYGYDKGMLPLIEAMPEILKEIPNALLVLAGSIHPLAPPVHKNYLIKCMKSAVSLGLQRSVVFTGKFLSERDLSLYLSAADIVAVNHQYVFGLFSSSASAHRGLACGRPLLMNSKDVRLSEFEYGKNCLKTTNEDIASSVIELYNRYDLREKLIYGANKYAIKTSFKNIAKQHLEVYKKVKK